MKYNICRTSTNIAFSKHEPKPCEGAILVDTNPDFPHWEIEINSLEDLNKLNEKVGTELIISINSGIINGYQLRSIEIYDENKIKRYL